METVLLCEVRVLELSDTGRLGEVVMAGVGFLLGEGDNEGKTDGLTGRRDKGTSLICRDEVGEIEEKSDG
jgi:hypothetical protein